MKKQEKNRNPWQTSSRAVAGMEEPQWQKAPGVRSHQAASFLTFTLSLFSLSLSLSLSLPCYLFPPHNKLDSFLRFPNRWGKERKNNSLPWALMKPRQEKKKPCVFFFEMRLHSYFSQDFFSFSEECISFSVFHSRPCCSLHPDIVSGAVATNLW